MGTGSAPFKGQRRLKQRFERRAPFGRFSAVADTVVPSQPYHEFSDSLHSKTSPVRPGLVPRVPQRPVTPVFRDNDAYRKFRKDITPWHLYPKADSSNVIERTVVNSGSVANGSSQDILTVYLTDDGTSTGQWTQQLYRIKWFGHAELNGVTGITYEILVDGNIVLRWTDFQLAPVVPMRDMHEFLNPLTVEQSIIFRVTNNSGGAYNFSTAGNAVDAAFYGWTEEYSVGIEEDHENVEGGGF